VASSTWPAADAEVFAPCAAAALYRREAFEEVDGFDEQFFCYFEDVDLGFRLRLRGYRCLYVHAAVVRHVSSALSGYRSNFAVYHGERNSVWTFVKNMPGPLLWMYLPQHLALNVAALLFYPWRGQGRVALKAKLDALRGLPSMIRRRRRVQRARRIDPWTLRRALRHGIAVPYVARYSSRPPITSR
jgi:GT2 family glycosyltransferase